MYFNTHSYLLQKDAVSIDFSMIGQLWETDKPTFERMIDIFIQQVPKTVNECRVDFEQQNWEKLYQTAHHLKSTLCIIQVAPMLQAIRLIETELKTPKPNTNNIWNNGIEALNSYYLLILPMLKAFKATIYAGN
ncbi:MAG: Hpt domain-containing protein [Chitinophagaceae bacterium]